MGDVQHPLVFLMAIQFQPVSSCVVNCATQTESPQRMQVHSRHDAVLTLAVLPTCEACFELTTPSL